MQEEYVPPIIEIIPMIKGFWCKLLLYTFYALLTFSPLCMGIWIGFAYDIWMGIFFFLFLTLVSGVVSSKMRVHSIPYAQREMSYSTMAIVKWYIAKNICFKKG